MLHVVLWYLTVALVGLAALPLAHAFLERLPSRGYALARPLGLLLLGYLVWAVGLTGQVVGERATSRTTVLVLLLALAVAGAVAAWRRWPGMAAWARREWPLVVTVETLSLALFVGWAVVTAHAPAINHTEKPMDFMFLNAVLVADAFPPQDPWLADFPVSYYYFGHLIMATLTRLTGIPSNISYNLGVALVPALAGAAALGLVYDLVRLRVARRGTALGFALLAPVFLTLAGNLVGVLEFARVRGWGSEGFWRWVGIDGLTAPAGAQGGVFPDEGRWWWWRGTRVINTFRDGQSLDYTITEFPFFSYLLGDLHPHMVAVPFVLLVAGLALHLYLAPTPLRMTWFRERPGEVLVTALALGGLVFLNISDFPVFGALLAAGVLAQAYARQGTQGLLGSVPPLLVLGLVAVAFYLPFYTSFTTQARGIWPVLGVHTRPLHFLLLWGLLGGVAASLAVRQMLHLPAGPWEARRGVVPAVLVPLAPFLVWLPLALTAGWLLGELPLLAAALGVQVTGVGAVLKDAGARLLLVLPAMVLAGLCVYGLLRRAAGGDHAAEGFALLLAGVGWLLLLGMELFFIRDVFGTRMNTVFKLSYQAWVLFSVVAAYTVYYWHAQPGPRRVGMKVATGAWTAAVAVLLLASLYYPVGATLSKTEEFRGPATLDGLAFLRGTGEYDAIMELRRAGPGRIVEAVGDSYSPFGRFAAATGRASPLNWPGHQLQWRGSFRPLEGRAEDVRRLYTTTSVEEARNILATYNVRYIIVGPRERALYGEAGLEKFQRAFALWFQSGGVTIYERTS